jgi:branched-subunit amino acid transport protein AzlD
MDYGHRLKNIRSLLKLIVAGLLVFNGVAALFGGGNLMSSPDGSSLSLSEGWLKHTPFNSYLIPGIILFATNGIFSFVVLALIVFGIKKYPWYVMAQGAVLTGWIVIQVLMIRTVEGLHLLMGGVGITLLLCGIALLRLNHTLEQENEYYFEMPTLS